MNEFGSTALGFMRLHLLTIRLIFLPGFSLVIAPGQGSAASIPLQPRDVFALRSVADVQIGPDSRRVAYVRKSPDIATDRFQSDVWLVDATGGGQRLLAKSAHAPRWSPDGRSIAYIAPDSAGHDRIFLKEVDGDTAAKPLTDSQQSPDHLSWNRDGSAIAYTAFIASEAAAFSVAALEKPVGASWAPAPRIITASSYQADGVGFLPPGHMGLFVVFVKSGATKPIRTGSLDVEDTPSWAPDGSYLVFAAHEANGPAAIQKDILYRAALPDGHTRRLSAATAFDGGAVVSPDGAEIAFVHLDPTGAWHPAAWAMRSDGSGLHPILPSLDRDVGHVAWAPDRSLFISYEDHGAGVIARVDSGQQVVKVVSLARGADFSLANDGSVGFALGSPDHPSAAAISTRDGQRTLTRLNDGLLQMRELGAFTSFDTRSSFDGEEVPGFMIKPPKYRLGQRYPTILWIHGGPYGDDGAQWDTTLQLFAAAGYVVLDTNPRGSRSYGFAHTDKLPFAAPGHDYDDLLSVVDAAVAQGVADPAHLYVTGTSYGGIMTTWIVGRTRRFRAAVASKTEVVMTGQLAEDQYQAVSVDLRGLPWEHPEAWWQTSPLALVGNVATPTMVIAGEDDRRTPLNQAEMFYDALRLRGVPSELVLYPEASHQTLTSRPSRLISVTAATLDWFGRYR
jgi:dipeptidyl aminopeptidase/acylaminoacyl peptidase